MTVSRRDLLKAGMSVAALAALPRPLVARLGPVPEPVQSIRAPRVRELAFRAVEAARAAGAAYADVRLTRTRRRIFQKADEPRALQNVGDSEELSVGVRVLVDGYWGFASSPVWSSDEMVRLGRGAVAQARVMAFGPAREVDLASVPAVRDEHWTMPVEIDPFEVSPAEIVDYLRSLTYFVARYPEFKVVRNECEFWVQDKAFASSEGSYCTQRLYRAEGKFELTLRENGRPVAGGALDVLTPAGVGWELYKGQPMREHIRRLMEEIKEDHALPIKPVDVGRYQVVCDARTVAHLVDATLGTATQLDRVMGYEANASGTSYLSDPVGMLGSYEVGAQVLSVRANRTERGGAGTVRWDDEGVETGHFALVEAGILRDFQTTRESATWLADRYVEAGRPARSHGCAAAPSALEAPLTHTPNLVVAPGPESVDFDGLVAGLEDGLAVKNMVPDMDFQGLNGLGGAGRAYEVKGGKRVARVAGAGFLFRAPELWKRLVALGGEASVRRYGMRASKGEPAQTTYHSVTAPAAAFEEFTVIDRMRKA